MKKEKTIEVKLTENELYLLHRACDIFRMQSGEFRLRNKTADGYTDLEEKLEYHRDYFE